NTYFEPDNARAAERVLRAGGYRVRDPGDGGRPLCCGRTFLAAGLVDEAKAEARRTLKALAPFVGRGIPVVGLEPSCLGTLKDEFTAMLPGEADELAGNAMMFEEFLASEAEAGRLNLPFKPLTQNQALVHGHCHQKAFDSFSSVGQVLAMIPGLEVDTIESSCCGMAGAFGYEAEHYDISMTMAERDLLPAVRDAAPDTLLIADGTSCRCQVRDGAGREALHAVRILEKALSD
ncbi:MAG: heterodisulfide reductase-related iron-sulfur binding cluster, partial [Pseudomonadota bacterium]|nr:heterodisulfide reductase-related iron-sulfur binding cluster [Pseudomonadota bacterium]